jgi:soluble lytic murein transglycosylase
LRQSFIFAAIIFSLTVILAFSPARSETGTRTVDRSEILNAYDAGKYPEAAKLLGDLKTSDPDRYSRLPYALLHAKVLLLQNDVEAAYNLYLILSGDSNMRPFCLLPLARIAATQARLDQAIDYYGEYLKNPTNPDYKQIALEAFDYCLLQNRSAQLQQLVRYVQRVKGVERLAEYYLARSYRLEKQDQMARSILLTLIDKAKRDDVTSLALAELDSIDGKNLTPQERAIRGKLAFEVWNPELSRKYLEPIATDKIEYSYYYARSLYFTGDVDGAKKAYQVAIGLWPGDPMTRLCISQYANICLRSGDYDRALQLLGQLPQNEDVLYRKVQALRARSRFSEALSLLANSADSRSAAVRTRARFVRGRLYFQTGRYRDALTDFKDAASKKSSVDQREVSIWTAHTLEKLNRRQEAAAIYRRLSAGDDYYAVKALEKTSERLVVFSAAQKQRFHLCRMPDGGAENEVMSALHSGDPLPAFLYLHLFEEAAQLLPSVSAESWKLVGMDPSDRLQRFLGIAHLALLGRNYAMATYYSELFLKGLPRGVSPFDLSKDVLEVLFPLPYKDAILKYSKERNIDPLLVMAIMKQESKFKRYARSQTFARGLMQLIPQTAGRLALALGIANFTPDQLYLPEMNINLGTKYIQDMMKEFGEKVEILAAGYNGGESNLRRWLATSSGSEDLDFFSNIDMSETKNYVMIVRTNYEMYRQIYGGL